MKKKIIGILEVMLLITTAIPALGFAEENEKIINNKISDRNEITYYEIQLDNENNIIPMNIDQLDQSQTQADNNLIINSYGCAQSFKPTLSTLTKFSLYLSSTFDINNHWSFGTYRVSIRQGSLTGTEIFYLNVPSSDLPQGISFTLTLYASPTKSITPGASYFIIISAMNPTIYNAAELYWWYGSWTSYTDGEAYYRDALTWWLLFMGSADFCFNTYGESVTDNPPIVVIESPADGTTTSNPTITVSGYADDDYGVASFGYKHEWTGDLEAISGTLTPPYPTHYPFSQVFNLHLGWNRITIFVQDSAWQQAEDQVEIYYVTNQAPLKPSTPSGPSSGKAGDSYQYSTSTTDPDGDQVYYQWDWGHETSPWDGPYNSGDTVYVSHIFPSQGTYPVKVKAKDTNNQESVFSDPLSVKMPKSKIFINRPFLNYLQQHPNIFPNLQKLLSRL